MVKPGRDLDVEVAKKILKLQVWFDQNKNDWLCYHPAQRDRTVVLPTYSTNSDHAYVIVNVLQNQGIHCHVGSVVQDGKVVWRSTFFRKTDKSARTVYGESMAHAICLAALNLIKPSKKKEKPERAEVIKFPKK